VRSITPRAQDANLMPLYRKVLGNSP